VLLLYVAISLVSGGSRAARVDSAGWPACELCGRRLSRVTHHRAHGLGRACHPRCKAREQPHKGEAASVAASAPPVTPRKRRAQSDPGELPAVTASPARTRRITAAQPAPISKKQRAEQREERIMRLLEETHARRMAAEAAAAAAASAHL